MSFAQTAFYVLEIIGIISFAISGAMIAIDKNADLFGVVVLALITAMGGGVMRDILLGMTPPVFFTSLVFVTIAIVTSLAVFAFAYAFKERYVTNEAAIEKINNIVDALGLGVFAVVGVKVTVDAGFTNNPFLIICMALITATGGGLLRDLMIMEIPFVLKKRIYAVAAILGASVYYFASVFGMNDVAAQVLGTTVTFTVRILATVFKWNFPKALGDRRKTNVIKNPK